MWTLYFCPVSSFFPSPNLSCHRLDVYRTSTHDVDWDAAFYHVRLDYGNATLAELPTSQLRRLQSVPNAAARLIHRSSRYEHVTPMLRDLHWLRSPEHIDFKLAVLVYRCLHGLAPLYLCDHIQLVADSNRRRLRSSSSMQLVIRCTRLSTAGDRAFLVAGCRLWNSLPSNPLLFSFVTSSQINHFAQKIQHL